MTAAGSSTPGTVADREATAEWYRRFAGEARGQSAIYEEWALGVAGDPIVIGALQELPRPKRQPNLLFAVSRLLGAADGPYAEWRAWTLANWSAVRDGVRSRSTQTNEPGRCAALLPLLGRIDSPIALLEVGSSAGLCLYPDRYSYDYDDVRLNPADGPSTVVLKCATTGAPPVPLRMPDIVWRAGIDLDPLDTAHPGDMLWLETLAWPEQHDRRERMRSAAAIVRSDPPLMVQGDATEALAALAGCAPAGATLVVVSAGVLVYLSPVERERFAAAVHALGARWISLEPAAVLPSMARALERTPPPTDGLFVLGLDARPVAWCAPHGQSLHWLDGTDR